MNKIIVAVAKTSLLIIVIADLTGCQQKKENPTAVLFEETMDLHDVAMARMNEIYSLKKALKAKNDSLLTVEPVDSASYKKNTSLIVQLDEADEAMMTWMAQFETKYQDEETEESVNYYKDQKDKIEAVSQSMDEAITQAEEVARN